MSQTYQLELQQGEMFLDEYMRTEKIGFPALQYRLDNGLPFRYAVEDRQSVMIVNPLLYKNGKRGRKIDESVYKKGSLRLTKDKGDILVFQYTETWRRGNHVAKQKTLLDVNVHTKKVIKVRQSVAINENRAISGSIMDFFNGLPKDLQEVLLAYPMNENFEDIIKID
jgi:hypothetical protein